MTINIKIMNYYLNIFQLKNCQKIVKNFTFINKIIKYINQIFIESNICDIFETYNSLFFPF